jgi:tRNA nucleotidyltransferase/poly(A) polymerase
MKNKKILIAMHGPIFSSLASTLKEIDEKRKSVMQEKQKATLTTILNALQFKDEVLASGGEIYAVGGIVRDAIMGKQSDDLDIVIRGIPYEKLFGILSKYGTTKDTSVTDEHGKKDFGATKFVSHDEKFNQLLASNGIRRDIDVMLPRKDSKDVNEKGHRSIKSDVNHMYTIFDDLLRRDITINAIALDLAGKVIYNGSSLDDIKNGVIRAVSEEAFIEDPLRMIRAIRFTARFNYAWDERTLELIKKNAHLLADKRELPKERFLMEFEKMIGKSDLGRAVKLLVELDLYKNMFGVDPVFSEMDYSSSVWIKNVGDFGYFLFQNIPTKNIVGLIERNITNNTTTLKYVQALVNYKEKVSGKKLDLITQINELSNIYRMSPDMLLNSNFVSYQDKEIARKFQNGELPAGSNDVAFKGEDFKNFFIEMFRNAGKEFNEKLDSAKMGIAKRMAIQAIYSGTLKNDKEAIKNFLIQNSDTWLQ